MGHLKIYLLVCIMSMVAIEARTELDWKSRATTLLCNHPGSRTDKATKIRKELHSTYPDFSFYISIMNEDVDLTYHTDNDNSSEKEQWEEVCGYNMFIWYKKDSKIGKRRCFSENKSIVKDIIRTADSQGSSNYDVMLVLDRLMEQSGIDFHLISVEDGNFQSQRMLLIFPVLVIQLLRLATMKFLFTLSSSSDLNKSGSSSPYKWLSSSVTVSFRRGFESSYWF